jgi:hypothetical protein
VNHHIKLNTRQAILVMETVKARLSDPGIDHADKVELHGVHQMVQHSMSFHGTLLDDSTELEPPIVR